MLKLQSLSDEKDITVLNALRVEALYNHGVIPSVVTLIGALIIFFIFRGEELTGYQISWLVLLLIISMGRYFTVWLYKTIDVPAENYRSWLNLYFAGVVLTGSVIGSFVFIFSEHGEIYDIYLLTMFFLVLLSGSIGIFSIYQRIYYGFNLPLIIPLIAYLFSVDNTLLNTLAEFVCLFAIFIFIIQYQSHRIIDQLLSIRLDNRNLIDRYAVDQNRIDTLESTNDIKTRKIEELNIALRDCRRKLYQ